MRGRRCICSPNGCAPRLGGGPRSIYANSTGMPQVRTVADLKLLDEFAEAGREFRVFQFQVLRLSRLQLHAEQLGDGLTVGHQFGALREPLR